MQLYLQFWSNVIEKVIITKYCPVTKPVMASFEVTTTRQVRTKISVELSFIAVLPPQ